MKILTSKINRSKEIFEALKTKKCLVLNDYVSFDAPGNSTVLALKNPLPLSLLYDCIPHFTMLYGLERQLEFSDFKLGINVVRIDGNEIDKEGLHVHLSHIFAIIFEGEGVLEWENTKGKRFSEKAKEGDCVIIPRGTLHYFTGKLGFSALEFSDIIDYQKHHYSSIE